jgi:nucleotide-binding universal stress UspA family protein
MARRSPRKARTLLNLSGMRYVCTVENGRKIPIDIERILVPVDFSEESSAALEYAIDLAARHHATVEVLHVWELGPYPAMGHMAGSDESFAQHVHDLATARLEDLIREHRRDGVEIVGAIESGEPIKVIPRYASRFQLIVMGAHDDDSAKGILFGNVADRVAGEVNCTVISVRREEEPMLRASNA